MPKSIALIVSRRLASLYELQTCYGAQDLYDLIEIIVVNSHNERIASERKD